ncbi:hypothetical protein [Sphingomonas sp. VNH70]|uniref:hypothetical protein n=1 Tax=Sphingomonas silueang TaxID=3156617 RepID=UPI0032B4E0FE
MTYGAEQRDDLRAVQRAVRDNVTVSEARVRIARDAYLFDATPVRATPRPRSVRALVGLAGLSAVLWIAAIGAACASGSVVTLLVRSMFFVVGVAVVVSIVRDVRTAIRWWRR